MKLIINNQEFEITQERAKKIKQAYDNGAGYIDIDGNTFFRGAITNSIILSEKKSLEKNLKNLKKEIMSEIETYNRAVSAEDKREIRKKSPKLNNYLNLLKNYESDTKRLTN